MQLIQTVTVGSGGAANITFSSIPQTFTDLYLVMSLRGDRSFTIDSIKLEFNGTTSGYSNRELYGSGADVGTGTGTTFKAGFSTGSTATSNTFGNSAVYLPNYTSSNQKSGSADGVSENNGTQAFQVITAPLSTGTAAITSIAIKPEVGSNWVQYSSASLYGILKGSDGVTTVS